MPGGPLVRWIFPFALLSGLAGIAAGCGGKSDDSESENQIPCDQLEASFQAYLQDRQGCQTVDDCTVVGGTGTCDCAPVLGNPSGTAIRADAVAGVRAFFDRLEGCAGLPTACDAAPAVNLRCEAGRCQLDSPSCDTRD
jgi:hypothetical protein